MKSDLPKIFQQPIKIKSILGRTSILTAGSYKAWKNNMNKFYAEQNEFIQQQREQKMQLLAEYFEVDVKARGGWKKLSYKIAEAGISGFEIKIDVSRGPKKKWDSFNLFRLFYEIALLNQKGHSDLNACRQLIRREPWSSLLKSSSPKQAVSSLNFQYQKALSDPFVKSMKKISELSSFGNLEAVYREICSGKLTAINSK